MAGCSIHKNRNPIAAAEIQQSADIKSIIPAPALHLSHVCSIQIYFAGLCNPFADKVKFSAAVTIILRVPPGHREILAVPRFFDFFEFFERIPCAGNRHGFPVCYGGFRLRRGKIVLNSLLEVPSSKQPAQIRIFVISLFRRIDHVTDNQFRIHQCLFRNRTHKIHCKKFRHRMIQKFIRKHLALCIIHRCPDVQEGHIE